jgi:predicted transcriptional regulator
MITMSATVNDVMTTTVVAVKQGASYKEMATLLRKYRVSAFPVLDDQKVIGIVSEADPLAKAALNADRGAPETADLGHRIVDKIRRVQGVVAVHDKLAYPPAEASFAGLRF